MTNIRLKCEMIDKLPFSACQLAYYIATRAAHYRMLNSHFSAYAHTVRSITCKRVSAKHSVIRTASLSYGNMQFSGAHQTKTPRPIVWKFCAVVYVGETTKPAKNGYNRLARGGSPYR
jgi:hypothetical protein